MDDPNVARHRIISSSISEICLNAGFSEIHTLALETLTELMKAFLLQLVNQSKSFSELQSRTEPNFHDIASSLIELGIDIKSFIKYARTLNSKHVKTKVAKPAYLPIPSAPNLLRISKPKSHPNYIYSHFPDFPDPHTYITTEVDINNDKDYQKSRELISNQKLNMEKSLVKFRIKSSPDRAFSIFNEDPIQNPSFSLIENVPISCSYLNALIQDDFEVGSQ